MAQHVSSPVDLAGQAALITGETGGTGGAMAGTSLDGSGGMWMD